MKCQTCDGEVPQKFAYAIAMNVCPLCGQQIMEPELQKVLNSLREVMTEASAQDYQSEAFDWLRSNFNLISVDSEEYQKVLNESIQLKIDLQEEKEKSKYSKPIPKSGRMAQGHQEVQMGTDEEGNQVQLQGENIQDPERTQVFLERANAAKMAERNNHYRKMVSQIRKSGSAGAEGGGGMGGGGAITPEMIMAASPEEVEEMEAMLSGGGPIASSSDYDDDDALDPIAESFIRNAGHSGGGQGGDYNPRDVAKLQALQSKSSQASKALDRGGSVGLIRR